MSLPCDCWDEHASSGFYRQLALGGRRVLLLEAAATASHCRCPSAFASAARWATHSSSLRASPETRCCRSRSINRAATTASLRSCRTAENNAAQAEMAPPRTTPIRPNHAALMNAGYFRECPSTRNCRGVRRDRPIPSPTDASKRPDDVMLHRAVHCGLTGPRVDQRGVHFRRAMVLRASPCRMTRFLGSGSLAALPC